MKRVTGWIFLLSAGWILTGTSSASELIAQWNNFKGLAPDVELAPVAGRALREAQWRFRLNDGSVLPDGTVRTGTQRAPVILFNGNRFQMTGYYNGGYTLVMRCFSPEPFEGMKPLWEIGQTLGIMLTRPNSMRGIWLNQFWNNNRFPETPFTWSAAPEATVLAFVSKGPECQSAFRIYVNGEKLVPDPQGLQAGEFNPPPNQFSFGNVINATSGGLNYRIQSIAVYNGQLSEADIRNIPEGTLNWKGVSGTAWTEDSAWQGEYNPSRELLFLDPPDGGVCTARVDSAISASHIYVGGGNYVFDGNGSIRASSLTFSRNGALTLDIPLTLSGDLQILNGNTLKVMQPVRTRKLSAPNVRSHIWV